MTLFSTSVNNRVNNQFVSFNNEVRTLKETIALLIRTFTNVLSPKISVEMKLLQLFVAFSIVCVAVDALKCPDEIWGCARGMIKKSHRRKHHHSKAKLRIQRDDTIQSWRMLKEEVLNAGQGVPCLTDDAECRAKIQELWERARQRSMDEKRQLDCPFGVWACKKRRDLPTAANRCPSGDRECQNDDKDMKDLIQELFNES